MAKKEYALFKGDILLGIGTIEELSKALKVKPKTICFYGTPSQKMRTSEDKGRRLVKLDMEDK